FPVKGHAAQVMATLASQRLKHAPGEMAVYCNDGFSLIEPLVAAAIGQAYTDFIHQEIFRPLGMRHSRFGIETLAPDSYATALRVNGEPYPQEYINVLSTGGIYSTPSDMGRLAMMLMAAGREGENRLLSASAVTEMGLNQSATLPLNPLHENDFGLGWDGVRQGGLAAVGVTAWHKNGGSTFFSTQFDVAPDEHLAVMIMAAGGDLAVETLAERILLQALAERRSIAGMPAPLTPHPPPPIPTPEADLLALVGHYAAEKLYRLEPGADQSLTWSEFVDGAWLERISGLQRRQGGDWIADSVPDRALLVIEADGRPHLALREPKGLKHYASARILGQLLASLAPLSTPWLARLQHRWLMVNDPYSTLLALGMPPLFNLWQAPGLRGYLMAAGKVVNPSASDERALMWTKVAARDLNDLIIVIRNGEEWVLWGSTLYRPLATLSLLATGHHLIAIGDEGLGEWRRLTAAAVLKVTAANSWYLYMSSPDFQLLNAVVKDRAITLDWDGRITGPAYLLVQGNPWASIEVTLG
ncbi:MAG: serine hydrolase domain-containing protein, partial [Chromatiaceae bacterium]